MMNEMNAEDRAALVKRLRSRDAEDVLVRDFKASADLIESDGERLALAEKCIADIKAAHADTQNVDLDELESEVGAALHQYDAAKEAL